MSTNIRNKYLVSKMTKREKEIIKMKANLYSMSIDELVRLAVDQYEGRVKSSNCPYCHQETVVTTKKPMEHHVTIADKDYNIKVLKLPLNVCRLCDNEYQNLDVSVQLEKLIHFEIIHSLREGRPIPEEIDFNELIKM